MEFVFIYFVIICSLYYYEKQLRRSLIETFSLTLRFVPFKSYGNVIASLIAHVGTFFLSSFTFPLVEG